MAAGTDTLHRELGAAPPASFATLDPTHLTALTTSLAAARKQQDAALAAASESGLSFIPRMLRGPVKKVLFR